MAARATASTTTLRHPRAIHYYSPMENLYNKFVSLVLVEIDAATTVSC